MPIRKVLLILIPFSALATGWLFGEAAIRYSGWVGSWPHYLALPNIHPYSGTSDRILLFPVRAWERRGLGPQEYPHQVHSDDSESAWTHRSILQGLYVYVAALCFVSLARVAIPRGRDSRVTWLIAGTLFVLIFIPTNLVEWNRTECCPDSYRGWPLWIAARDYDTGGDSALKTLWRGNRPAVLVNAALSFLASLGTARILRKLNSSGRIAAGGGER